MAVVRISIRKYLIRGAYPHHHSIPKPFATEYVVRTSAPFPSPILREYARNIALAESRLYHTCVPIHEALVKLATPGLSSEELRGKYSHVDLDKLCGELPLAEDEMLAYPPVAAYFDRQADRGRHGRLLLPYALTTNEWNLYVQKRVFPKRYQYPGESIPWPFSDELSAAISASDGTFVMAGGEGDTEESLRPIWDFFFYGFQVNTLTTKRKKSSAAKKAAARRAALLQQGEEGAASPVIGSKRTKPIVPGLVYMLQSGSHFKIGKTINLDKRLTQLKIQLPQAVTVVHTIKAANPLQVESHWHRRFAARRLNGEWFELTSSEVSEFKSVSEM